MQRAQGFCLVYSHLMTTNDFVKPFAAIAYAIAKNKQKRLGYTVEFTALPEQWLQAKAIYPMDQVWKREGLDAVGTNYFTIGDIENGLSSRFDPLSPYYQAWLGCYIVQFNKKRSWEINDHFRLGEADQKNWLRIYGDTNPRVDVDWDHVETLDPIQISGFASSLYRGNIFSDTDVGDSKISLYNKLQLAGLAEFFNKTNPTLRVTAANLLPKWQSDSPIGSYQNIQLRGYVAILDITDSVKAVAYANAAVIKTKDGQTHDHFQTLDSELLQCLRNIQIKELEKNS